MEPHQTFFRFIRSPSRLSHQGQPAMTEASPLVGELTQTLAHAGIIRTPRVDTGTPFDRHLSAAGPPLGVANSDSREVGIDRKLSSREQRMAAIEPEKFEVPPARHRDDDRSRQGHQLDAGAGGYDRHGKDSSEPPPHVPQRT